ncbi:hypothetical protein T484DRAFT_1629146, partial [Baffinella frigidus]
MSLLATSGITLGPHPAEVKMAYRARALEWHPDKHAGADDAQKALVEARFKRVGEALEVL